jgi:hypothetical protein
LAEVDILGASDRRRIRSAQEKAALLAEIYAAGGKVRLVAGSVRIFVCEELLNPSADVVAAVGMWSTPLRCPHVHGGSDPVSRRAGRSLTLGRR